MKAAVTAVLLFVLLGSGGPTLAWQPNGWVYHMYPLQYDGKDGQWHYLHESNDMGAYNFSAKTWRQLRDIDTSWLLVCWPYVYEPEAKTWHYMDPDDLQWTLNLHTKSWSKYGTATSRPARFPLDSFSWTPHGTTATLVLPKGWGEYKNGITYSGISRRITPVASETYKLRIPNVNKVVIQMHRRDGAILEYNFDPRSARRFPQARTRCICYTEDPALLPRGWTWKQSSQSWVKYETWGN